MAMPSSLQLHSGQSYWSMPTSSTESSSVTRYVCKPVVYIFSKKFGNDFYYVGILSVTVI